MIKNIFITGATCDLGRYLVKELLLKSESNLWLLIRCLKQRKSTEIMDCFFGDIVPDLEIYKARLKLISGDITFKGLGLSFFDFRFLCSGIDEIFHCAALTNFEAPLEVLKHVNVTGTKNMLDFAEKCNQLKKFHYISSVFISGNHEGDFSEEDFDVNQSFKNAYEKSKFEAEALIRDFYKFKKIVSIYRPSIIVGDYVNGKSIGKGMVYLFLRMFQRNLIVCLPNHEGAFLNIIPCDVAAKLIYSLCKLNTYGKTYHIISSTHFSMEDFIEITAATLGLKIPNLIPFDEFKKLNLTYIQKSILKPFLPYFNSNIKYLMKHTKNELEKLYIEIPLIDENFISRIALSVKNT